MHLRHAPRFGGGELPEELFIKAMAATSEISLITDASENIQHVSESFTAITGYTADEVLGRNCRMLQGPGTDVDTRAAIRLALDAGEPFRGEILNYRKDGSAFWNMLSITPLASESGELTHFVSVQRDINTRMALHEQLRFQALHDPVTGLPNRLAMNNHLVDILAGGPRSEVTAAVGMIDLDDFRVVNNTFGHEAGDMLLKEWAARIQAQLRDEDFLGRMGGDEFVLILSGISRGAPEAGLTRVLERLSSAVEVPFSIDGRRVTIGMSMGLALFPEDGFDTASLLKSADEALYEVKTRKHGRRRWWELAAEVPSASDGVAAASGASVSDGVASASASAASAAETGDPADPAEQEAEWTRERRRDALYGGGLSICLQPVIDLRDGSVHLFEALARLTLPNGTVLQPAGFVKDLSAFDLDHLFSTVLEQSLAQLAEWDRQGLNYSVSVNLPPTTLLDPASPDLISSALARHGIAPHRLGLELLESQTLEWDIQREALSQLVRLGVGLAMDDLGAGYSSLKRLSSLPFNAIKLDRDLLADIRTKPSETLSLIATLIQMGRDFGMNVVIEGIEDEGIAEAVAVLGAPLGQGFHFSRPLAPQDAAAWVEHFRLPAPNGSLRTCLGALAYHWQFARLGSPHPRALAECPLSRFLASYGSSADVGRWHIQQHDPRAAHAGAGRLLVDWLVRQIRTPAEPAGPRMELLA
ncbi:EAL domain-containing protein [Arthrobacter crusticola]|uniref:EAL domain-containing protein n=1 Tax=Arthrobacter crusticola TaxID=2547960 RepID=A0A4R5TZL3_9MICC|nr:EAL domain-containing protein [Arthrobacter crusticola]TDK26695.1 EAL domain-containing protein [Arthrobacter crusticola]